MEEMLRRHLLLLGGSGTGKTNTVMLIAQKLLTRFTKKDVMVFFDLNGVYRSAFYEKGDVVLSDGEDATGDDGDDYWNLFNEVEYGARLPESVERLAKAVFRRVRGGPVCGLPAVLYPRASAAGAHERRVCGLYP